MAKSAKNGSSEDVVTIDIQPFLMPISIILASIILSIAMIVASNNIGGVSTKTTSDTLGATTVPTQAGEEFPATSTDIDDDPIIGNKDTAKVAIVEFSDYECPYCKRHFTETNQKLIDTYVNSGEAILVFRDFPLSFHDPLATDEAIAAECVDKLSNDETYFKYHDLLFTNTTSNGQGLTQDQISKFAQEVGVDATKFKNCYDNNEFADEVKNDLADGQAAGVSGTPGFVIGVLKDDGTVEGKRIDGAYPFAQFETIIKEMLAK